MDECYIFVNLSKTSSSIIHPRHPSIIHPHIIHSFGTADARESLDRRIQFCLTTHNNSVIAMRYLPSVASKAGMEDDRGERMTLERELERALEESDDDEF